MKIIRLKSEDLGADKAIIRKRYEFDSKDKDNEIYRILIPSVPNSDCLTNVVESFIVSKNNSNNFYNKYSFHCANREVVLTVKESVDKGGVERYREFEMPVPMTSINAE